MSRQLLPLRFSLRWFLVACAVAALLLAYFGESYFAPWRPDTSPAGQQRARDALIRAGVNVEMEQGCIVSVKIDRPGIEPRDLRPLKDAVYLEQLSLLSSADDELLQMLERHEEMRELVVSGPKVTSKSLPTIGKMCRLQTLSLLGCDVSDESLKHLALIEDLRSLDLSFCKLRGSGLAHLSRMPALETLNVSHSPFDDSGLVAVGSLRTLRRLDFADTAVRGAGLAHLGKLPRLQTLELRQLQLTDGSGLVELDQVHSLLLDGVEIAPKELSYVAGMERLVYLGLQGPMFTDEHVAALAQAKQIRTLSLSSASEKSLAQLHTMERLEKLTIPGHLSEEAAQRLSEKLPRVAIQLGTLQDGKVYGPKDKR